MKKFKIKKMPLDQISDRYLLLNLYGTQILIFIIACIWIVFQKQELLQLLVFKSSSMVWIWGIGFAGLVLIVDSFVSRYGPSEVLDDGGMNERLFLHRPYWHIAIIALIVAICEELLFRGALQYVVGIYWTSVIFAAIHIRYLRHWLLTGMVFGISYGLGWIYDYTGSLWTPITAHFFIDFILGSFIKWKGVRDDGRTKSSK